MSEFQDALDNVKTLKSQDAHDTFIQKTKTTIKGSAVGVVVGLMYGWYNKKNLYVSAILGAIGGGAINYFLFKRD
jgi:ABC-type amino acid transport system permease subunit